MVQRLLPAQRRFSFECAGIAVLTLLWLVCLVLGLGGQQTTQAISNFGLIAAARLREGLAEVAERPYGVLELALPLRHRDGHRCTAQITITNLLDNPSVGGLVLNTRDISERRQLEDQLVHQAFHDSLTSLANRALFKDPVDHALRRTRRHMPSVAVLFLDLDGFKEVNDSLGHAAGTAC